MRSNKSDSATRRVAVSPYRSCLLPAEKVDEIEL